MVGISSGQDTSLQDAEPIESKARQQRTECNLGAGAYSTRYSMLLTRFELGFGIDINLVMWGNRSTLLFLVKLHIVA